jgi:hypothetical protein
MAAAMLSLWVKGTLFIIVLDFFGARLAAHQKGALLTPTA